MHYMVYLDEFGHIGPFISRYDRKHKTSPVFGMAGVALPVEAVREFSMFFFKLKSRLLAFELNKTDEHPAKWEKKGSALYTVKNVSRYPEIHRATIRYLNKIRKLDGFIFHTGIEKGSPNPERRAEGLYFSTLKDAVRRLSKHCANQKCTFSLFLDSVDSDEGRKKFRNASVENTGRQMFADGCYCLVEPPYQLESHLYQTMQCADWVCALIGRLFTHQCSTEFDDFEIFKTRFEAKLNEVKACSSFKEKKALVRILKLPDHPPE